MTDEREAFEAWADRHCWSVRRATLDGSYTSAETQSAWFGWQARAQAANEPAAVAALEQALTALHENNRWHAHNDEEGTYDDSSIIIFSKYTKEYEISNCNRCQHLQYNYG